MLLQIHALRCLQVKKAFRKLALQHHPDKNNGSAASTELFKVISAAYEVNKLAEAVTREEDARPLFPARRLFVPRLLILQIMCAGWSVGSLP